VNLTSRAVALLPPEDPLRVELVPTVRVVQGMTDLSWADRALTEAVEAAATTGDRKLAAHALVQRGLLRLFTDPDVTPEELFDVSTRAIDVFEELGDELGLARAWRLVAQAHYLARQAGPSTDASERALGYAVRTGNRFEEREIVEWLVIVLMLGPTPASKAAARFERLLDEATGTSQIQALILAALAHLVTMQGRRAEAGELLERSQTALDDAGEWVWIATFWWGYLHVWHGDPAAAERALRPAYDALKKIGEKSHFNSIAYGLAAVVYLQGRYDEAESLTHECEEACRANDVHSQILWRSVRAKVFARRRAFDDAERLGREAIEFAQASDFLPAHADALADLAEVLDLANRREEAACTLEDAIQLYQLKGNRLAADKTQERLNGLR
jgi:tetratricopeptide (TPR) repeat protein